MNEEEVQIDLMTLLHYILRKWRSIIVMMLILQWQPTYIL